MNRERVAIIGVGVAGLTAAHLLQRKFDVTLYEKNDYLGGHTNTVIINEGEDQGLAVDTGFIVCNNQTYPNFHRVLKDLKVEVRWSDMSFSYYCEDDSFRYAGTTLNGLFADRSLIISKAYWQFLREIYLFSKKAITDLEQNANLDLTLAEYVRGSGYSEKLLVDYIVPLGAAIWSASDRMLLQFPARTFINFFKNHGLLSFRNRPRWQTVVGGSNQYVKAFEEKFSGTIKLNAEISGVSRDTNEVKLRFKDQTVETFDYVVLATHADQALGLLGNPTNLEQNLLSAWEYQLNEAVLHTDENLLPVDKRVWASWNVIRFKDYRLEQPVSLTYHMNRLQGLKSKHEYCVTLNQSSRINPEKIIRKIEYTHPVYTLQALKSQEHLPELNNQGRTFFCGSYFGYGFHEDAVKAGLAVARKFDLDL